MNQTPAEQPLEDLSSPDEANVTEPLEDLPDLAADPMDDLPDLSGNPLDNLQEAAETPLEDLPDPIASANQDMSETGISMPVVEDGEPNLDIIMKIPVDVQVILGTTKMPVSKLMKLGRNAVIALDRQVGDPIDVVVNGRTVARGEVVLMENDSSRFGISISEIVGPDDCKEKT